MVFKYLIPLLIINSSFAEVQEDIQVNATKLQTSLSNIPASIDLIQSDDIEDLQPQNLDELLALIPGVNANESPRSSGQKIQIRGIDSSKIIVLIDGARQNFRNSHNSGLLVNQDLIKKVEVMKGPSSSIYGSGAVGGLVSFETKSASDLLKTGESIGAKVKGSYRSANELHHENIIVFGKQGNFDAIASVSHSHAENIRTGKGDILDYSGSDEESVFLKMGNNSKSKHHVQISYERIETDANEPSNPASTISGENPLVDNNSQRDSVTLRYKLQSKNSKWLAPHLTSYFSNTTMDKDKLASGTFDNRKVKTTGMDLYNNSKVYSNSFMDHHLTYGVELVKDKHDGSSSTGELGTFPDGKGSSFGVFLQDKVTLFQDLNIIPGLRYDSYKIESSDSTNPVHNDNEISAKLALSYNVNEELTVFSNYAEGFNAPRMQDLYISGSHFPGNVFTANPNLKAERTKTYELGLKTAINEIFNEDDSMFLEATVFKTDARDFIKREVNSLGGTTMFENVSNADFKGFEIKVGLETDNFLVQTNYAQTRSEDLDTKKPLNDTPADEWNLNLKYNFSSTGFSVGYHGVYAEEQSRVDADAPGVRAKDLPFLMTNSYNIHNIYTTWKPVGVSSLDGTEFIIKLNNIFDKKYRKHTTPVSMPGRDIQTTIKYRF